MQNKHKSHDLIRVGIFNQVSRVEEVCFFSFLFFLSWMWRLCSMSASPSSQPQRPTAANLQRKQQQSQQTPASVWPVAPVGLLTRRPRSALAVHAVCFFFFHTHPAVPGANGAAVCLPHSNLEKFFSVRVCVCVCVPCW